MEEYEEKVRLKVLHSSLELEGYATFWLSIFLDVDSSSSKTLGNKSSALSLNNKVNLLIDLGALNSSESEKFLKFMEIRNQFMHNPNAKSFEDCFRYINGIDKWFIKKFGEINEGIREEQFDAYYTKLSKEVLGTAAMIFNSAQDKIQSRRQSEKNKIMVDFIIKELPGLVEIFPEILETIPRDQITNKTKLYREKIEKLEKFIEGFKKTFEYEPPRKIYKI